MAHVLVIDDDPVMLTLTACAIEALGHSVTQARQGRAGLQAFADLGADLVVTDIVMPDQEGIETIRAIRAVSASVPILAISGSTSADAPWDYLKLAAAFGASGTLYKPFSTDQFMAEIARLLPEKV